MNYNRIVFMFLIFMAMSIFPTNAVNVTVVVPEYVDRPRGFAAAQANLAAVLTEINRAEAAHETVSVKNLQMNEFAKKSLARLWAVTPFKCMDDDVVAEAWVFKGGNMMVRNIPLEIKPQGESFGMGTYQEAVAEFDANGMITDFRFSIDAHMSVNWTGGQVQDEETKMAIFKYLEQFRTAYNQKDIKTIEQMFSDDALIITGHVVRSKPLSDSQRSTFKVEYNKQSKEQYIQNLKKAFVRNKWIDVKFDNINPPTRSKIDKTKYGIKLHQSWKSSNYSDEGTLFLLWEIPENGGDPIIHVRTWSPEFVDGKHYEPSEDLTTLGGFDL